MEAYFADGSGSGEPIGLVDAATEGTHSAIHTALGADDIITWYHDLPFGYRARATWLMADSSIKLIRQITNAVNTSGALNYVWAPGLGGNPDTLMGRPVYPSAGFAAFAAGEEIGVFGDISQYMIVDFGAPTMIRDPYTRAKYNEVSFIGCYITDTALPVAEAVRTLLIDAS
jgi:HK97 family phage major capsid protein